MKIYKHNAKVCGKGRFPIELLCIESAFPTEDLDASAISLSFAENIDERGFIINISKLSPHRSRKGGFNFDFWRAKNWEIIPTGTTEEEIRVNKNRSNR